eukprot:7104505-Karenia_brevis.AAC.1
MIAKTPALQSRLLDIFGACAQIDYRGVYRDDLDLAALRPAPMPGSEGRHQWKSALAPQGP